MSRNAKILIDLAVLAAAYGIWLLPKWRRLGKRPLLVYTLMYGCLAGIVRFTLMPVLAALPYCFDHPYIPMHMAPLRMSSTATGTMCGRSCSMSSCFFRLECCSRCAIDAAAGGRVSGAACCWHWRSASASSSCSRCCTISAERILRTSSRTRSAACSAMHSGRLETSAAKNGRDRR